MLAAAASSPDKFLGTTYVICDFVWKKPCHGIDPNHWFIFAFVIVVVVVVVSHKHTSLLGI